MDLSSSHNSTPNSQVQQQLHNLSDYFDIDDILKEDFPVPVTFAVDIDDLLPESVTANKQIEIPLWLCEVLAFNPGYGKVVVPETFNSKFLEAALASPADVDMSRIAHFYDVGLRVAHVCQESELLDDLLLIAVNRFKALIPEFLRDVDSSYVSPNNSSAILARLSVFEKNVLKIGRDTLKDLKQWAKHKGLVRGV
ncbi:hypothetical protein P9112_009127 [Eukaryota sp. TZLM1-RC]